MATYLPLHYPLNTYDELPQPIFSLNINVLKSMIYCSAFFLTSSTTNYLKSIKFYYFDGDTFPVFYSFVGELVFGCCGGFYNYFDSTFFGYSFTGYSLGATIMNSSPSSDFTSFFSDLSTMIEV